MTADLDLIRRAANQMRELAEGAIASSSDNVPEWHSVRSLMGEGKTEGDAEHIAKWDPVTALAVADWLDDEASRIPEWATHYGPDARPIGECPAAKVARAFLKEDADV